MDAETRKARPFHLLVRKPLVQRPCFGRSPSRLALPTVAAVRGVRSVLASAQKNSNPASGLVMPQLGVQPTGPAPGRTDCEGTPGFREFLNVFVGLPASGGSRPAGRAPSCRRSRGRPAASRQAAGKARIGGRAPRRMLRKKGDACRRALADRRALPSHRHRSGHPPGPEIRAPGCSPDVPSSTSQQAQIGSVAGTRDASQWRARRRTVEQPAGVLAARKREASGGRQRLRHRGAAAGAGLRASAQDAQGEVGAVGILERILDRSRHAFDQPLLDESRRPAPICGLRPRLRFNVRCQLMERTAT